MKKTILMAGIIILLGLSCASVFAQEAVKINPSEVLSAINSFDDGKFTGSQISWLSLDGPKKNLDILAVIDGADGKHVFQGKYKCIASEGFGNCRIATQEESKLSAPAAWVPKPGEYVFRFIAGGKNLFEIAYKVSIVDQDGNKSVALTGDWNRLAMLTFNTPNIPEVNVSIYRGGAGECVGDPVDAQVELFKEGKRIARGIKDSPMWSACGPEKVSFVFFDDSGPGLVRWVPEKDLTGNPGKYELKYYRAGKLEATYVFEITSEGKIASNPPAGLQKIFLPESMTSYDNGNYIYAH